MLLCIYDEGQKLEKNYFHKKICIGILPIADKRRIIMGYMKVTKTVRKSNRPLGPSGKKPKPTASLALEKRPGMVLKEVTKVFRGETYEWLHVLMSTGEELKCTREHPFSVKGKGWVAAFDLQPEDEFLTADGRECKVTKTWIEALDKPETTYNFEVEGCHNYFVGESGVLVHNICVAREGNLRADVKPGGDIGHPNVGHAHIYEGSDRIASVLADGTLRSGHLTKNATKFVTKYLDDIATGIDKYYWMGRIR